MSIAAVPENNLGTDPRAWHCSGPDFDSRSYGYGKLSDLIKATTLFEIERHSPGDGKQALMYAREKRRAAPARRSASAKTADA